MAGTPGSNAIAMQDARESLAGDEEPLNSEEGCSVIQHGTSLFVCVTNYGQKTHSIDKGDEVTVHTYRDRIVIEPEGRNGGD